MLGFSEITPPTGVTHATSIPFTAKDSEELVVARTNLLQVFRVRSFPNKSSAYTGAHALTNGVQNAVDHEFTRVNPKLVLVGEYHVAGTVTSLSKVRIRETKSGGFALLVSFREAKASLVQWDPEAHGLSTISIHYYEGDEPLSSCWVQDFMSYGSYVTVDPSYRCAALRFAQHEIAVIPFPQQGEDANVEDQDTEMSPVSPITPITPVRSELINGDSHNKATPYSSSFVVPLTALEPDVAFISHAIFLHEYREPTLGVIYSVQDTSDYPAIGTLQDSKLYSVYSLDTEQQSRTLLFSVPNLPSDLWKVVPLPPPTGGSLLVGNNEIIHVDPTGKTVAIAVNDFAKKSTSMRMKDRSDWGLQLKGCIFQQLEKHGIEFLLIPSSGRPVLLKFELNGRIVLGLDLQLVVCETEYHGTGGQASCATCIGHDMVFVGSNSVDSLLLRYRSKGPHARQGGDEPMINGEAGEDEEMFDGDEDEEKDLSAQQNGSSLSRTSTSSPLHIWVTDDLLHVAADGEPCLGICGSVTDPDAKLSVVLPSNPGDGGILTFLNQHLVPEELSRHDVQSVCDVWAASLSASSELAEYDNFLVISFFSDEGLGKSRVYNINSQGISLSQIKSSEFAEDARTLSIEVMANKSRLVQVLQSEIKCYDKDLQVTQMMPILGESTEEDLKIAHVSTVEPYMLLVMDDSSIKMLKLDSQGELDELDLSGDLAESRWMSGSVHQKSTKGSDAMLYVVSDEGSLHMYDLPDLRLVYQADSLGYLPRYLPFERPPRWASKTPIEELLVADLGDDDLRTPCLMIRTEDDDVEMYQPYHFPEQPDDDYLNPDTLRWIRIRSSYMPNHEANYSSTYQISSEGDGDFFYSAEDKAVSRLPHLSRVSDVGGRSVVFIAGKNPSVFMKGKGNVPRCIPIGEDSICCMTSVHLPNCDRGIVWTKNDHIRFGQIPKEINYVDTGWCVSRMGFDDNVDAVCYFAPEDLYIVGTSKQVEFSLPDDDPHHWQWADESLNQKPKIDRGAISLLNHRHWTLIQGFKLDIGETVTCMKTVSLEISEITHERQQLVVIGTETSRGEDLPCIGYVHIFQVKRVVPEPGEPASNYKLHRIAKQDTRGGVTALSEVGNSGLLLIAFGPRTIVRGLKEDGTFLPVAFLDVQCYMSTMKPLEGTGMTLLADATKGLWLTGFARDPYRMTLFGKSETEVPVVVADFMPLGDKLFTALVDDDGNLFIHEYNPEDRKSLSGQRLVHQALFHTGQIPISMTSFPSIAPDARDALIRENSEVTIDGDKEQASNGTQDSAVEEKLTSQLLVTTDSGALCLLTPLNPATHRRLTVIQSYILSSSASSGSSSTFLDNHCSLHPRAYRTPDMAENYPSLDASGIGLGRSVGSGAKIIDGSIVSRWKELGTRGRSEMWKAVAVANRSNTSREWEIARARKELDWIMGKTSDYV